MDNGYVMRSDDASAKATFTVVDANYSAANHPAMLGTDELLAKLKEAGVRHVDMARALGLPTSRIAEMYSGKRGVRLDEGKALVEAFNLDEVRASPAVPPINEQTARLLVLHVANTLGVSLSPADPRVRELALDFQAFSKFARDHLPAPTPDATSGFLYGRKSERSALD